MPAIGFIGLGTMGFPMACNLARNGTQLRVWNRTPKSPENFPNHTNIEIASSAQDVLWTSDTIIFMLLNQTILDSVLERNTGAFADNVKGKTIVNMGSVDPDYSIELASEIASIGGCYLEAPVSGSRLHAEGGQLVCLLGGDPIAAQFVAPLLEPMCKSQIYCGEVGNGLRMKLAINLYLCSTLVALAEATNFAKKADLPLEKFTEAIEIGPLHSEFLAIKLPKMIASDYELQAAVSDAYASTRLIQTEAARLCAATPQLKISSELYARTVSNFDPRADMSSVLQVLELL